MKILILLILSVASVSAQIVYPVNFETNRFTFKQGTNVVRGMLWPRMDGQQLFLPEPDLLVFLEVRAVIPAYNPNTHKLDAGTWVDDVPTQMATFTHAVVALNAEELAIVSAKQAIALQRQNLANGIATLRTWADQAQATTVTSGNAVATLQTMVNRLGVFFDNFADLLEVQNIAP